MKIIVLGAAGQLGSIIYKGLRERYEVIGTSRKEIDGMIKFDPFRDDWSLLGKSDVMINCVGQIEATKKSTFEHIHVDLTKLIIRNRDLVGASKIIQVSALGASEHHDVAFLRTKGIADKLLLNIPGTAVIRPSIVCTPRTMMIKKMLLLSKIGQLSFGVVPIPSGFMKTKIQPVMPQDFLDLVEKMCFGITQNVVNAVGPETISLGQMIEILKQRRNPSLKLIEFPKMLVDVLVKFFVGPILPGIINWQQYQLLFEDNIADATDAEKILGRPMISTKDFFINEFTHAAN